MQVLRGRCTHHKTQGDWLLLQLRAELGAGSTCTKTAGVIGSGKLPPRFQKKARGQAVCPERGVCGAARVKLRVHWQPREVGGVSNVGCLRKAARTEQGPGKTEAASVPSPSSATGAGPSKPPERASHQSSSPGHGTPGFSVCSAGFQSCFAPVLFYALISPFWNGSVSTGHVYVRCV